MNFLIFTILGLFFVKHISVFPGRFSCAFLKNPDKVGHISDPYLLGDLLDRIWVLLRYHVARRIRF